MYAAHKLGFGGRRILEMHATQGAPASICGNAGLNNDWLQAVRFELPLAKTASKKASLIFSPIQLDDEGTLEFGLSKNHVRLKR